MMPGVISLVGVMNKDEEMQNMLKTMGIFVDHLDELIGVFENDYAGGDFCAGLSFGFSGSNLLYKVAEAIIHTNIKMMKKKNWHVNHDKI